MNLNYQKLNVLLSLNNLLIMLNSYYVLYWSNVMIHFKFELEVMIFKMINAFSVILLLIAIIAIFIYEINNAKYIKSILFIIILNNLSSKLNIFN